MTALVLSPPKAPQFPDDMITVIGAGNMGRAFTGILIKQGLLSPHNVTVVGGGSNRAALLANELGCQHSSQNYLSAAKANVVIIACPEKNFVDVLLGLAPYIKDNVQIISTVPGKSLSDYEKYLGKKMRVTTIIPNPAFEFGASLSIVQSEDGTECWKANKLVGTLFRQGGKIFSTTVGDARQLPTASAVSGCGPAFVAEFVRDVLNVTAETISEVDCSIRKYLALSPQSFAVDDGAISSLFLEFRSTIIDSCVSHGFSSAQSEQLFCGALEGYLSLREQQFSPDQIIQKVATPGGTTETSLKLKREELDLHQLKSPFGCVVAAAAKRMGAPFLKK